MLPMIRIRSGAAVWTVAIILAAVFVSVGILKLEGSSAIRWSERFVHWGYPAGSHYVAGALEVLAGLGVLIPKGRRAAAAILVGLMVGALFTHLVHAELPRVVAPLALGLLALLVATSSPAASS